jgi:predicted TPR repeat methyltransferase
MTPLAQKEPAMSGLATVADPASLTRRVHQLIDAGRPRAAWPLLAALRRLVPISPELDELAGRLSLREGRVQDALAALDAAIGAAPGQAGLHLCRADARMQADDTLGAALDAAEAVVLDPTPQAKPVLGTVLLELERLDDALVCLGEAVRAAPGRGDFRRGLAAAQERAGDSTAALATLQQGIAQSPRDVELRIAAIRTAIHSRAFDSALALAIAARDTGLADARVFGLLGHALSSLGRHEEAGEAYTDALRLGPEDAYVRHLVAASGRLPGTTRAPADYVRVVFDGCAKRFGSHRIELGYRIPGLVRAALLAYVPGLATGAPAGPLLDLGCGTGFIGVVLSDLPVGPLIGVDLSPGMLAEAKSKELYAALHQADIETFLAEPGPLWPIIIAADVLCYFGPLEGPLLLVADRLTPRGVFVLSVELSEAEAPDPWRLGPRGRYTHTQAHLIAAAESAGLRVRDLRAEPLRNEDDLPVEGLIAVLERPA